MDRQQGDNAHDGQCSEFVPCVECQPVPPHDQQGEQEQHHHRPDESQLFRHDGEYKVVFRLGDIEEFLSALAQPQAQQAAGADGQQGLHRLKAVPLPLGPWVQPQIDAGRHIGGLGDDEPHGSRHQGPAGGEPAQADPGGEEDRGPPRQH